MEKLQLKIPHRAGIAWERIGKTYNVTTEIVRYIEGRRVVSSEELCDLWGIAIPTLRDYVSKKKMPKHECSEERFVVYDLAEVIAWRNENITPNHGNGILLSRKNELLGLIPEMGDEDGQPTRKVDSLRKAAADADRAEEEALIATLKRKQLEESLIDADDLDIALAELATVYQTTYSNDKKILPVQLKGKTDGEIRKYLDEYYENRMSDLNRLINKSFPNGKASMYEIISVVLERLDEGYTPDELLGKI